MNGFGLYLPKIFRDQKFTNNYNIPFIELKNKKTFVDQGYFEEVLNNDKMQFNYITTEMVLRGGKFILESDSYDYPENILTGNKIIYSSVKTPNEAYRNIDFETLGINYIKENLKIYNNNFFHNVPLDGFRTLYLTDTELEILEEEFLNAGFKIYKANDNMLSLPKEKITITKSTVNKKKVISQEKESSKHQELERNTINSTMNSLDTKPSFDKKEKQSDPLLNNKLLLYDNNQYKKVNKNIQSNSSNKLYFRISQKDKFEELPKWVEFFIEIGRYIAQTKRITLYINYLDDIIPASFISLGIMDSIYNNYEEEFSLEKWIDKNIKRNQEVSYLYNVNPNGNKEWKKAKVIDVKRFENMDDKFNPYLIIELKLPQQKPLIQQIPKTNILNKIRVGGRVRNTAGSTVLIDDKISNRFKKLFSKQTIDIIKFTNQQHINLIGHGKKEAFEMFSKSFSLYGAPNQNSLGFKLSDWFYFEDTNSNLANINIVNSKASNFSKENINLFVGANAGLRYYNFKNKKNIFLVNRMNNSSDSVDRLTENLEKEVMSSSTDITSTFIAYLENVGVSIPKGVELYAYH